MQKQFDVSVVCMTYNQSSYIEDTMKGFVIQRTSFPYICFIIDDASTDGSSDIVREYSKKYDEELYNLLVKSKNYE